MKIFRHRQLVAANESDGDNGDQYYDRLQKLVPGEAMAAYTFGALLANRFVGTEALVAHIVWILVMIAVCVFFRYQMFRDSESKVVQWPSVAISTMAFVLSISVSGPDFLQQIPLVGPYVETVGGMLTIAFVIVAPHYYKGD